MSGLYGRDLCVQKRAIQTQANILNTLLEAQAPNSGFVQRAPGSGVVKLTLNERSRLVRTSLRGFLKQCPHMR